VKLLYNLLWPVVHVVVRARARSHRMPTADRALLEDRIFADVFRNPAIRRILFVGVSTYTSWYPALFAWRPRTVFATVDIDPDAAVHGAARHRVGGAADMAADPGEAGSWDIVFLNGIFGYGTDEDDSKRATLEAARALLRPGGLVVLGYRPATADRPADIDLSLLAREGFEPAEIPGLGAATIETGAANAHTFAGFRAA
jgi:hypothetical protein